MKMKVIFIPYWILATIGFSERKLPSAVSFPNLGEGGLASLRGVRKHLPPDGEGKRDDEDHKQSHLRHEEHEDLPSSSISFMDQSKRPSLSIGAT